jgi:glucuronate isomerase
VVRAFADDNFLLPTRTARRLYREKASPLPLYDFHGHLSASLLAEDRPFAGPVEAWVTGDHYKARAMRTAGVAERLITGDAPEREKFRAWASVAPATLGNPLHQWTHLELARCFGVSGILLGPETADAVFDACSAAVAGGEVRARGLLARMGVSVLCTTDDPADALDAHARLAADPGFPVTVAPTFRPDRALAVEDTPGFNRWLDRLSRTAGTDIRDYAALLDALRRRHEDFHAAGCRSSDHGLEEPYAEDCTEGRAARVFADARAGRAVDAADARAYRSALLLECAGMDAERGWVMQLHLGAIRNLNSRAFHAFGPDAGFDAMGDAQLARPLARFLDMLDREDRLPKTVLYCLNPGDGAMAATIAGCFPREGVPARVTTGPAWWFNDTARGMEDQMRVLGEVGLLSRFIGMTTDSRSFLSFPRHELFRRVLCGMLGGMAERGEVPADTELLGRTVEDICWNNAASFFAIPRKGE